MLTIKTNTEGNTSVITLEGNLDTNSAPEAEALIRETAASCSELVLDLKQLNYISSAGLRVLLIGQKLMNSHGKMILKNVDASIMSVLDMTGFSEMLTFE